uniref:hypothetical protein n=1 Tax=Candidatus Electrothrix sp. TaxID=2170559 RepID=UPI0040575802
MTPTQKILFFFILLFFSSSLALADRAGPVQSPVSYRQISFNGEMLAQEIAQTTGLALNPILCMSALGAYHYFSVPERGRADLPWYVLPQFWGPLAILLGMIFLKDTFGAAFPKLLKSPLDAVEILFEKNTSALIALPVLISSVQQGQFQQLEHLGQRAHDFLFPVALAAGSAEAAVHSGLDVFLMSLTSVTAIMIFIVVWVLSQAFNVLILLCPFSLGDAMLSAAKSLLVVLIIALSGTYAGAFLAVLVIALALYLFPKTLRLVVFGTIMSHDLVFYKLLQSREGSLPTDGVRCFSSCYLGPVPPLTFGKLALNNGVLHFSYRSFLFFTRKTINTGIVPADCEVLRGILSPVLVMQEDGSQVQLFRVRPKFYRESQQVAELLGVKWTDEAVIVKRLSGAVQWCLGVLRKAPRLDVPSVSV